MNIGQVTFRVVDTETTGLDPAKAEVCELGTCEVFAGNDGRWIQSPAGAWLCNPGMPIPPEASAVHHIIDRDVAAMPYVTERFNRVLPLRGEQFVYVAHNAGYDRTILERAGFPTGQRWLCTWRLALHVWPDAPSYKNEVLRYWLGYAEVPWVGDIHDVAHRAAHDVAVTALILREAIGKLPTAANHLASPVDVDALIKWAESPVVLKGKLGFGKHFDETWGEVANTDARYLDWMIKQDDREPGAWDADKIYTARYYRGRLS